jgi:hypothetical protein
VPELQLEASALGCVLVRTRGPRDTDDESHNPPFVRVRANSSLPRFTAPAAASVPSPAAKREIPESPTCSVVTSGKPSVSDIAMPPPDGSSVTECRESDTLCYPTGGVP